MVGFGPADNGEKSPSWGRRIRGCTQPPEPLAGGTGRRRTHDDEDVLEPPAGSPQGGIASDVLFVRVPETKKSRTAGVPTCGRGTRPRRLPGCGRSAPPGSTVGQRPDQDFVVVADPGGNEFCVLRVFTKEELDRWAAEEATGAASGQLLLDQALPVQAMSSSSSTTTGRRSPRTGYLQSG
jgi:hypothetical protein